MQRESLRAAKCGLGDAVRQLLLAIQEELRQKLDPAIYRPGITASSGDVFISTEALYLPTAVKLPAIGIKDGGEPRPIRHACGQDIMKERYTSTVLITCWSPSDGAAIGSGLIGDVTQPGVLDTKENILNILRDNLLGYVSGDYIIRGVELGDVEPSTVTLQGTREVQSLIVPIIYDREITVYG